MFELIGVMFSACFEATVEKIPCVGRSTYEAPAELGVSRVLSQVGSDYAARSRELRGRFTEMELLPPAVVQRHTHGLSAGLRNSASTFADHLGAVSGKEVKFVQASGSDQANGRVGSRTWAWVKDQNATPASVEHGPDDLAVLVDVDYYLDMPELLSNHPAAYLLYTFQPSAAARDTGEYKYTFMPDGEVKYIVSGGATYRHKVWDWDGDSLHVATNWCCFPKNYTGYSIERRRVDEDHQLVLLTPYKRYRFLGALLARWTMEGRALQRIDPRDGSYARITVNGSTGLTVSTARLGGFLAATVPVAVDEAIMQAAETSKEFTRSMAMSKMVGAGGDPEQAKGSEVYVTYVREKLDKLAKIDTKSHQVSLIDSVNRYQYVKNYHLYEPGRPAMVSFMNPFLDAAYVADRCLNNDERTVDKRVTSLQKDATPPTAFVVKCMHEFAKLLWGCTGSLHPVDYEEVYERQNRPTQRRILELAEHETDDRRATAMQKAEAYATANDPRNITVMNGPSKREHSKWMYALYTAMKEVPWYAFGRVPVEIAELVALLCKKATTHWLDTDFSRQDGRVNSTARLLESIIMLLLFHPKYKAELLRSMDAQTFLHVRTKFGVRYNSGNSRASGSGETSVFNTILTAFVFFLAWRMSYNPYTGDYYTAGEAWSRLGVYGGDDGGTPDADPAKVEKAAKIMGQVVETKTILKGTLGVQFLARRYGPGVWEGEPNSCCDIVRQLSKFHVTVHLNRVTGSQKLCEKSFAFSLSDSETPIIGPFVKKVLLISQYSNDDYTNVLKIWNGQYDRQVNYPNIHEPWMDKVVEDELPDWKYSAFRHWLEESTSLYDLMTPPRLHEERPVEHKAGLLVVNGEFVGTPEPPAAAPSSKKKKKKEQPKRHRVRNHNQHRSAKPEGVPKTSRPPTKGKRERPQNSLTR